MSESNVIESQRTPAFRSVRSAGWVAFLSCLLVVLWSQAASARSLPDFTDLVEENSDAVVNISTTTEPKGGPGVQGMPFSQDQIEQMPEFFKRFFGGPQSPFNGGQGNAEPRRSIGSGFIVSKDGYVLTNNHVVDGADKIIVRLSDRRELPAKVIGTDARSDIAVLKVDAKDLPVVDIGKSKDLKVGEWVFAIGSPFGFDHTVTAGIVSAVGRSLPTENYVPFIQTDVAINPGNSGGPLFNMDGEVVGINSQIYTRSGGFMGVSFSIPIDDAMNVFKQIREKGTVSRGWLGVLIQEVNRDLAESFGLKRPRGALIAEVMDGSPAAKAGLQSGDIVLAYNGEEIQFSSDLPPLVGRTAVGETAELTVLRGGDEKTIDVTIGQLPAEDSNQGSAAPGNSAGPSNAPLGLSVQPLPSGMADSLDIKGGVVVTGIGAGAALEAGIQPRDVITEIDRKPIRSVDDYTNVVKDLKKGKAVSARIIREGHPLYLVIKP
ncbi:DegQ family serine endoprotease [Marinobacter sp. C2H3]|uniref:DegQ family serine endoprotease n=1 Tax=Marinobacter sp. C2H3 TaxID=3119003 RepID=UPI00300E9797